MNDHIKIGSKRQEISKKHITGSGLEIGALQAPLWVPSGVIVKYVDRLTVTGLRNQYPELDNANLVDVDIVDDGEKLATVADTSVDFIIANHMLEHCENPLGTIRTHLSKIKDDGILYYAVPDSRHTFDIDRPLVTFEHLVKDDTDGPTISRNKHYYEWASYVSPQFFPQMTTEEHFQAEADRLKEMNYSIHFHVWNNLNFKDFLHQTRSYLNNSFEIEHYEENSNEIITLLKKK